MGRDTRHKCCSMLLFMALLLCSCTGMSTEDYLADQEGQLHYEYEYVDAEITDLNIYTWFAGTRYYQWNISLYYEPYGISYQETSYSQGVFNAPSFLYKTKGDTIRARIKSKYVYGELAERTIDEIK